VLAAVIGIRCYAALVTQRTSSSASGAPATRIVAALLWLALIFLVVSMLGAHMMRLLEGKLSGGAAFGASIAFAFVVSLVLPALFDWRMTRAAHEQSASARSMFGKITGLWNAVVLLVLVFALPLSTRAALVQKGDWLALGLVPVAAEPFRSASTWLGEHIPRSGSDATTAGNARSGSALGDSNEELQPRQVFERLSDTVVVIHVQKELGEGDPLRIVANMFGIRRVYGLGSGFVVEPDGIIVTNHHVVDGATSVEITLQDRRVFSSVDLLVLDRQNDLALIGVKGGGLHSASIRKDDDVKPGERAIAVGAPLGLEYSVTDGIVSAVRELHGTAFLQMQTTIAPGSSGSPLFDAHGRVMGVNTATRDAGLNLAVSARHVRELLGKPRTPKSLAAFVHGPHISDVRVEGAETSSVDRMALQEALDQIVVVLEGCARGSIPDGAHATFTFPAPGLTPETLLAWATEPEMETDLDSSSARCLLQNAKYGGPLLSVWLLQNYGSTLGPGKTVALFLQVDGFGASETDKNGKKLDLRFRLVGQGSGPSTP
jgi:S1-C subfamily serine protease